MNGVLNLDKPTGWTSHDVVAKVRGLIREKQIGHLGTLDPLATGVLPLAVGLATRLIEFASYPKEYVATCLLGKTTDSCDVTGKVLNEKPVTGLSPERIREEVLKLKNITEQVPPMVSAVKSGGRKLYELARKGVVVERKPRPIKIEEMEVLKVEGPRASFRVVCSPGTYVRVLCESLGEALGVGGCMESLRRTRVGPYLIAQSHGWEDIEKKMKQGDLSGMLLPSSLLVGHLPAVTLGEEDLAGLCQGRKIQSPNQAEGVFRVLNGASRLCAIAESTGEGLLKPRKVFGVEGLN